MFISIDNMDEIDNIIKTRELMLLKFDNKESKYNEFIDGLSFKVINITDEEIIDFYDIDVLPTILVYKDRNLMDSIKGFHTKTVLLKKIMNIIEN
uniref:Thioredoxin domain-containing protein n=1 Tax=viral metagenome TaxID=1070528 RepID=A0A6C0LG03_9ZZZZ